MLYIDVACSKRVFLSCLQWENNIYLISLVDITSIMTNLCYLEFCAVWLTCTYARNITDIK